MDSDLNTPEKVRLRLLEPCDDVAGMAPVLARALGIHSDDAAQRLTCSSAILAEGIALPGAARAVSVLRAMGVRVSMETGARRFDMAILPRAGYSADVAALAASLSRSLAEVASGLGQSGGIILQGLGPEQVERMAGRILRVAGVQVELSDPECAVYDVFSPGTPALRQDLQSLGLGPCRLTGALATDLDLRLARWIHRRHDICAVDRKFQRYNVYLMGTGGLRPDELADFVGLRAIATRSALTKVSRTTPVLIESGLRPEAARQFASDYAMIGLPVRLQLAGQGHAT